MDKDPGPKIRVEAVLKHGNEAMHKPGIKTITAKKLTRFLLIASIIMLITIGFSFRALSQTIVENKALALSRVIIAGLTAHMQSGTMPQRKTFLGEIRQLDEVKQITIIRSSALKNKPSSENTSKTHFSFF